MTFSLKFDSLHSVRIRKRWLSSLQRGTPPNDKGYDTKLVKTLDGEAPVLELWGVWEHPFIAITPRSSLTRSDRVPLMGKIDLFKNSSYLVEPWATKKKSPLKKQQQKM